MVARDPEGVRDAADVVARNTNILLEPVLEGQMGGAVDNNISELGAEPPGLEDISSRSHKNELHADDSKDVADAKVDGSQRVLHRAELDGPSTLYQ